MYVKNYKSIFYVFVSSSSVQITEIKHFPIPFIVRAEDMLHYFPEIQGIELAIAVQR